MRSAAIGERRAWPASRSIALLVGVFSSSALGAASARRAAQLQPRTASPTNIGFDVLTFSATAALIGGVSLSGGKGSPVGIAAGVLSLSVLEEILAILGSPDYVSSLITGGLLDRRDNRLGARDVSVVPNDPPRLRGRGTRVTDAEQIRLDPDPL